MKDLGISLIVITYNHEAYIDDTLESIRAQDHPNFEVILVDDASTDETSRVVGRYIAKNQLTWKLIANERNRGLCANLNIGLGASSFPLVAFLDGDDILLPHRLSTHAQVFDVLPENVGIVFSDALMVDDDGQPLSDSFLSQFLGSHPNVPAGNIFSSLLNGNFLPVPATTVRRSVLDVVGGFDESLAFEDWDMWLRVSRHHDACFIPTVVSKYRTSTEGMSRNPAHRAARWRSEGVLLSKWVADDLSHAQATTLKRKLMGHARKHLTQNEYDAAAETIRAAGRLDPTPVTKVYASLLRFGWGARLLSWSAVVRRRVYASVTAVRRRLFAESN